MKALVIRNGNLSGRRADVLIEEGKIAGVGENLSCAGALEIDACGDLVLPGFVDAHVHFNEPGRAGWEGIASGSRALAAGGGTVFCDMPLNSDPPVLDAARLVEKRRIGEEKSVTDFALWGGLCPGHVDAIPAMAEAGAVAFKAFMSPSGIAEFPHSDAATLRAGMKLAQACGRLVGVHAEDPALLREGVAGDRSLRAFFESRPKAAEVSAIRLACELAGETGAALHVVHVTCAEGLEEIAAARRAGVDVTAETCPHYLLFDAEQAVGIGARAKCAPPLRAPEDVEALWAALDRGLVDTVGSDHSPAPAGMKTGDDFFEIWGGISGCQHGLVGFLGEYLARQGGGAGGVAELLSGTPASRFGLGSKGRIASGWDGDLIVVSFGEPVAPAPALYRHPEHLYEFHRPRCVVRHVVRRGEFLVRDGVAVEPATRGRFLQP